MIKITISRTVANPSYDAEFKDFQENSRRPYERGPEFEMTSSGEYKYGPKKTIVESVLEVELTEEQYAAVKKATIEAF